MQAIALLEQDTMMSMIASAGCYKGEKGGREEKEGMR